MVGVPPSTLIDADFVAAETYCGLRRCADAAARAGTKIEIVTLRIASLGAEPLPGVAGKAGTTEPVVPPLHPATKRQATMNTYTRQNTACGFTPDLADRPYRLSALVEGLWLALPCQRQEFPTLPSCDRRLSSAHAIARRPARSWLRAKTRLLMIVDDADGLQKCVDDRRADEGKTTRA